MADDRKILHEFKRNSEETLRISLSTFKGRTYVDIRMFYEDANGELAPTKKGVTITPELWDEFRNGVARAEEALQEKNLWHKEGGRGRACLTGRAREGRWPRGRLGPRRRPRGSPHQGVGAGVTTGLAAFSFSSLALNFSHGSTSSTRGVIHTKSKGRVGASKSAA